MTRFPSWAARGDRATVDRYVATAALLRAEQPFLSVLRESLLLHPGLLGSVSAPQKNEAARMFAQRLATYYRSEGLFLRRVRQLGTQLDDRFVAR